MPPAQLTPRFGTAVSRRARSRTASLAVLGACGALAALPGAADAAKTKSFKYAVTVEHGALAKGKTVDVNGTVASPEAKVKRWWSRKTVSAVVRKGVDGGYQRPYKSEGYGCTPLVKGETTSFTCTLRGADVPTIVKLRFAVVYRGATRSG